MTTYKVQTRLDTLKHLIYIFFFPFLSLLEYRESYTKNKKTYVKQSRLPSPINLTLARSQLDKEFKTAMQKQDQKIELAMKMYDLVSRHIERLDSQVMKTGMSESEWIRSSVVRKGPLGNRKRPMSSAVSDRPRKRYVSKIIYTRLKHTFRIHHSSRPNPSILGHSGVMNDLEAEMNEPLYCYCNQVSFGDMVACDSESVSSVFSCRWLIIHY